MKKALFLFSRAQLFYTAKYPTSPFPILEPQNPWTDKFPLVRERRVKDFKAPKLRKGSSRMLTVLV